MFFKSKKPEVPKEDSRIQDLQIITQMNQEFATSLDLNETLKQILNVGKNLNGFVLILDLLNLNFRKVKINKSKK